MTQSAAEIIRWQRQGAAALARETGAEVVLHLADGTSYEHTGQMTGAEPHVDETTGVVTLRMEFDNPDGLLLPGMYVLAEIPQARLEDVILAPQEGVTRDRRGRPVAYVVNADNVVEERALDIVQDRGNTWVVRDGLAAGERMVVAGFQRIAPGAVVTPEERAADDTAGDAAEAAPEEAASEAGAGAEGEAEAAPGDSPGDAAQEPDAETEAQPAEADAPAAGN